MILGVPHKPGPKTETPGLVLRRKTLLLDETTERMLNALAAVDAPAKPNASRTLRRMVREAYRAYQRSE